MIFFFKETTHKALIWGKRAIIHLFINTAKEPALPAIYMLYAMADIGGFDGFGRTRRAGKVGICFMDFQPLTGLGERGSERPVPADLKCAVYRPFPAPVGTFWRIWRPVLN